MIRTEHLSDSVTLHLGDCREVLPTLPRADAIITDPPYGVNKAEWDANFPDEETWAVIAGALRTGGSLLVFPGELDAPLKLARLCRCLEYQWVLVWYASNAMQFGKTGFTKKSLIWWFSNGDAPSARPKMPDLYECAIIPKDNAFGHPSPKPLDVMMPLVEGFSVPGDLVCDPFLGSGTTGVAAVKLGRRFVGCEISPTYFDIAVRRIADALARPDLFIDRPVRAERPAELDLSTGRP